MTESEAKEFIGKDVLVTFFGPVKPTLSARLMSAENGTVELWNREADLDRSVRQHFPLFQIKVIAPELGRQGAK